MFGKFDLFEDVVDKDTLQIKNYELAYKLKRHLECDEKFNAYSLSRDMGIMDYVSSMRQVIESRYRPSLVNMAIELLMNDLPVKRVADITELDMQLIEKLDELNNWDLQGECKVTTEERNEIASDLIKLDYLKAEAIAKKTKLTVEEVEILREEAHKKRQKLNMLIIEKMLNRGDNIDEIADFLEISVEEVENAKKKLKL